MRISDWSSDVCSSDLAAQAGHRKIGDRDLLDVDVGDVLVAGGEAVLGAGFIVAERGAAVLRGAGHHEKGKTERAGAARSEERRVGKECVSTCRARCTQSH